MLATVNIIGTTAEMNAKVSFGIEREREREIEIEREREVKHYEAYIQDNRLD